MKHLPFLFLSLIFMGLTAHSQVIKGKLVDPADNKPLQGATLALRSAKDSTAVINAFSDSTGAFQFNQVGKDTFFLTVSYVGYEEYRQLVSVNDSTPSRDLGQLYVPKSSKELTGVTVTTKTPPVSQKGDTLQFNASQYKVNPDATIEDLVKKAPGVTVDRDGTVTAQGEQVKKVTIDGKDFFGDDASAALRNLPADVVDKIQVYDRLSDQATLTGVDDGNTTKALNIVTKSGLQNGQFGRFYAGYGTDDRYSAGGNVSFFKGTEESHSSGSVIISTNKTSVRRTCLELPPVAVAVAEEETEVGGARAEAIPGTSPSRHRKESVRPMVSASTSLTSMARRWMWRAATSLTTATCQMT